MFFLALSSLLACGTPCEVDGVTYADGDTWTCADGCNTCACENGAVASTLMACEDPSCTEGDVTYAVGDTWTCDDGCNTCSCEEDGSVSRTEIDCG
jgi:hypothetical protein